MSPQPPREIAIGPWAGFVDCPPDELDRIAAQLPALLAGAAGGVSRHDLAIGGVMRPVVVKTFRRQWWRDSHFRRRGTKSRRSFELAAHLRAHGVAAPRPIAWLDRWERGRLLESHYVYEYEHGSSMREAIDGLLASQPEAADVLALMRVVAAAVARMHQAGVIHFDLGNQNVLVDRIGEDGWGNVRVIDLDRARRFGSPTLRLRARDLSRIDLPSALLPMFHCMYFGDRTPPAEFARWERHYRRRYAVHTATRPYRHPFRTLRTLAKSPPQARTRPAGGWMWDERSAQAIGTRTKRDRYMKYPWRNGFYIMRGLARTALPVHRRYRACLERAFTSEVAMHGRIGIAAGGLDGVRAEEHEWLARLGALPLQVRLHRHAGDARNARVLEEARRAHAAGHPLFVSLLQDRACVDTPSLWRDFVRTWLPAAAPIAQTVEVGHAVNRVKWGVDAFDDYRRMVEAALAEAGSDARVQLVGPAAIDFEYHYLVGVLDALPEGCFAALSHHLYVDRRGAPENRQGPFSAIEKFALAKAIAACSPAIRGDRLIVSEVNWPLTGVGVHSPVRAPYFPQDHGEPHAAVDENTYASYMVRYCALALCSGLVEQVYWWRLAGHGFGLIDDAPTAWRPRPGFHALRQFVRLLGDATFVARLPAPADAWALAFRKPDSTRVVMAWSHPRPSAYQPDFPPSMVLSRDGDELAVGSGAIALSGNPVYLIGATRSSPG